MAKCVVILLLVILVSGCAANHSPIQILHAPQLGFYLALEDKLFTRYQYNKTACWRAPAGYLPVAGVLGATQEDNQLWYIKRHRNGLELSRKADPLWIYLTPVPALPNRCLSLPDKSPLSVFDNFVAHIEESYHFVRRNKDHWLKQAAGIRHNIAAQAINIATATAEDVALFDAMASLLKQLDDPHLFLLAANLHNQVFGRDMPLEQYNLDQLTQWVEQSAVARNVKGRWYTRGRVFVGRSDELIYIAPISFAGLGDGGIFDTASERLYRESYQAIIRARRFAPNKTVMVDLRFNAGGAIRYANLLVSALTDKHVIGSQVLMITSKGQQSVPLGIAKGGELSQANKMIVLVSPQTASAAEHMTLTMREMGAYIVGCGASAGALSPVVIKSLPNGWLLGVAPFKIFDAAGNRPEGVGLSPDIQLDCRDAHLLALDDPRLEQLSL